MKKLVALFLLLTLLCGCTPAQSSPDTPLFVHFIDVGQADCTLFKCGDIDILIDAGDTGDGWLVTSYLTRLGVDDLELVIATHPHADHIGGMSSVLNNFSVEQIWTNGVFYNTSVAKALNQQIEKQNLNLRHPAVGEVHTFGDLQLTVLGPVRLDYDDINNTSIVVMVQFGEKRFLMTGDMESVAEAELLEAKTDLKADVLKVGHHGSYSSSSNAFLEAVDAEFCFIPVGVDNDYGHPHDAAVNRLRKAGITRFRADTMGNVVVATRGDDLAFFWDAAQVAPAA